MNFEHSLTNAKEILRVLLLFVLIFFKTKHDLLF